jgi:NADPH:quinone reductase-like Zn-dependent oxidoreductase
VVTAVGHGVTGYGDAVIVWSQARGTYTQYVAVPADTITLKPERLSFAEAAGVAHASLAARNLLIDPAKLRSGQTVLVLGGGGGVGSAAVQIATNRGAHVIATASARNADYLKALGASTKQIAEWSQAAIFRGKSTRPSSCPRCSKHGSTATPATPAASP